MKTIKILKPIGLVLATVVVGTFISATIENKKSVNLEVEQNDDSLNVNYTKAYVDFDVFDKISADAKEHRSSRLINFTTFNRYSGEENTIILDTRSKRMYDKMHIKGAIHINFADFTQEYLAEMIPDTNTRILIYCNNNFAQEPIFEEAFATKMVMPEIIQSSQINPKIVNLDLDVEPSYTMALNIPTYINLYGYHYRNVYELGELVSTFTLGLELEGTDVAQ
jgi:hypothetical protein